MDKIEKGDTLNLCSLRADNRYHEVALECERSAKEADALTVGGIVGAIAAKSSAIGGYAILREALKCIVAASIVAKNANAPEWILQRMADIFAVATTALSAPPRNCDRFQTVKQAKEAYCAEVRHVSIWDGYETERLVKWLLAPATEKEGGVK